MFSRDEWLREDQYTKCLRDLKLRTFLKQVSPRLPLPKNFPGWPRLKLRGTALYNHVPASREYGLPPVSLTWRSSESSLPPSFYSLPPDAVPYTQVTPRPSNPHFKRRSDFKHRLSRFGDFLSKRDRNETRRSTQPQKHLPIPVNPKRDETIGKE